MSEANGTRSTSVPTNGTVEPKARRTRGSTPATSPSSGQLDQWTHPESGVEARVYVGDCRDVLPGIAEVASHAVDLIFADPPFNWNRAYDKWDDALPVKEYLDFTYAWLDLCTDALAPSGSLWVNIPDSWAAEIVVHLKKRLHMVNWCVWHYRFGQNCTERFIGSKVHALYFSKQRSPAPAREGARGGESGSKRGATIADGRTWNPGTILEQSDRASIYNDPRTYDKNDGMPGGMRVPMDVWYGQYWGRIQGNNKERRIGHDNQLPEVYLERVVRACSNAGDLVLDPFLGSGTTGVIAHALERRFIGIEFSKENAKRAAERMKSGPIRLGALKDQSSAIFGKRTMGEKRSKRIAAAKAAGSK